MRKFGADFEAQNSARNLEPRYVASIQMTDAVNDSNLLLWSEAFDNTDGWEVLNTTVVADSAVAPNGTTTADEIDDSSTGYGWRRQIIAVDMTQRHTFSVFVLKDTTGRATRFPRIDLHFQNGGVTEQNYVAFDTSTGELDTISAQSDDVTAICEDYDSNYWRVSISATPSDTDNTLAYVYIYPAVGASASWTVSAAATGSIFAWGAQLEANDLPNAYVKTTVSAWTNPPDRQNLLPHSESFDDWLTGNAATVTADTDDAPDGTTTADTIEDDSGLYEYVYLDTDGTNFDPNLTYCASIFLLKDTTGRATRFPMIRLSFRSGVGTDYVDLRMDTQTGEVSASGPNSLAGLIDSGAVDYDADYWRFWLVAKAVDLGSTYIRFQLYPAVGAGASWAYDAAATGSIIAWGAQVEESETLGEYLKTTAGPIAYQPGAGENLLPNSYEFDAAVWFTNGVVTANSDTAPDGTTTADTIEDTAAGGSDFITDGVAITVTSGWYTGSIFIKKDATPATTRFIAFGFSIGGDSYRLGFDTSNGSANLFLNPNNGTFEVQDYSAGWWRIRISAEWLSGSSNTTLTLYPAYGDSADLETANSSVQNECVAWGAQIHQGARFEQHVYTNGVAVSVSGNPNRIWLTSHASAFVPPGVAEEYVFRGVISESGISGFSQRLDMATGKHSIGNITIRALDVDGGITEAFRQRLLLQQGLRRKVVQIYKGHADLPSWQHYELYRTHLIDGVTYMDGVYTIETSDIQREEKSDIFDVHSGVLTSSITTATSLFIPITIADPATKFPLVYHGADYSDNPSDSVGYVRIDDEIIAHNGWNGAFTYLNVVERGALGTTAASHIVTETEISQRKKVEEYIYLEMPAVKLVYALLTGVLYGDSATLPDHWNLQIDTAYVRLADFTGIGADLWDTANGTGRIMQFTGLEKTEGKKFIEKELLKWLECFQPVYSDGAIGLKRYPEYSENSGYQAAAGVSEIVRYGPYSHDMKALVNSVAVRWNWIDRLDRFTQTKGFIDADSITKHGQADLVTHEFKGVFSGKQVDTNLYNFWAAIRGRYANPPVRHSVSLQPSYEVLEVGDSIRITNPHIRDFNMVDTVDRVFGVEQAKLNWSTGLVDLQLFGGVGKVSEASLSDSNVLSDSFYNATGTELSTVLTISADAVTADGTLTGAATPTVFYYLGDLTINAGVTLTIERNVELRIRGTFTVLGDIVAEGDSLDGQVGVTTSGHSIVARAIYGPQSEQENYAILRRGAAANLTAGLYANGVPAFNIINPDGSEILGQPTDLAGMQGATGATARIWGAGTPTDAAFDRTAAGGAGGAGGGGLQIICRGMAMGISSQITLSAEAGSAGSQAQSEGTLYVRGQTGAGGFPGGLLVLIDGDYTGPIFNESNVTALRGAQAVPGTVDSTWPDIQLNNGEEAYGEPIGTDTRNHWAAVTRVQYIPPAENGYTWLPYDEEINIPNSPARAPRLFASTAAGTSGTITSTHPDSGDVDTLATITFKTRAKSSIVVSVTGVLNVVFSGTASSPNRTYTLRVGWETASDAGGLTIASNTHGGVGWPETENLSLGINTEFEAVGDGGDITITLEVSALALDTGTAILDYDHGNLQITVQEVFT